MTKPKSQLAIALGKKGPPYRSEIYFWLREQYHDVVDMLNGPTPNWVEVAARAEAAGKLERTAERSGLLKPRGERGLWFGHGGKAGAIRCEWDQPFSTKRACLEHHSSTARA